MQSDVVVSHSVAIRPRDSRCKYWAKVVRDEHPIPVPSEVSGASDIPVHYAVRGEEELLPGDALLEGEANHHRRTDRGWTYRITVVDKDGRLLRFQSGFGHLKAEMKARGMSPRLLMGSGDVAAMVRIVHGLRLGILPLPDAE